MMNQSQETNLDISSAPSAPLSVEQCVEKIQLLFQKASFHPPSKDNSVFLNNYIYVENLDSIYDSLSTENQRRLLRTLFTRQLLLSYIFPAKIRTAIYRTVERMKKYILQSGEWSDIEKKDVINSLINQYGLNKIFSQNAAVDEYLLIHFAFEKQNEIKEIFSSQARNTTYLNEKILDKRINYLSAYWYALCIHPNWLAEDSYAKEALFYLEQIIKDHIGSIAQYSHYDTNLSEQSYYRLLNADQEDLTHYKKIQTVVIELQGRRDEIYSLDSEINKNCDEIGLGLFDLYDHLFHLYQILHLQPFYESAYKMKAVIIEKFTKKSATSQFMNVEDFDEHYLFKLLSDNLGKIKHILRLINTIPTQDKLFLDTASKLTLMLPNAKFPNPGWSRNRDALKFLNKSQILADLCQQKIHRLSKNKDEETDTDYIDFCLQNIHYLFNEISVRGYPFLDDLTKFDDQYQLMPNKIQQLLIQSLYAQGVLSQYLFSVASYSNPISSIFKKYILQANTLRSDQKETIALSLTKEQFSELMGKDAMVDFYLIKNCSLIKQQEISKALRGAKNTYLIACILHPECDYVAGYWYISLHLGYTARYLKEDKAYLKLYDMEKEIIKKIGSIQKDALNKASLQTLKNMILHTEDMMLLRRARFNLFCLLQKSNAGENNSEQNPVLQLQDGLQRIKQKLSIIEQRINDEGFTSEDNNLRLQIDIRLTTLLSGITIADEIEQLERADAENLTPETVFWNIRNLGKLCQKKLEQLEEKIIIFDISSILERKNLLTSRNIFIIKSHGNVVLLHQIAQLLQRNNYLDFFELFRYHLSLTETQDLIDEIKKCNFAEKSMLREQVESISLWTSNSKISSVLLDYANSVHDNLRKQEYNHEPIKTLKTNIEQIEPNSVSDIIFMEQNETRQIPDSNLDLSASNVKNKLSFSRFFSPSWNKRRTPECLDKPILSLPDGNCAYNSMVLFLRKCFLDKQNIHWLSHVLNKLNQTNEFFPKMTLDSMTDYFKTTSPENTQRYLSPILRKMATSFMNTPETRDVFLEYLGVLADFMAENPHDTNIPYADTFLVHPFIQEKLETTKKAQLKTWWNDEGGFTQYLSEISKPASSAGDRARWGADPELNSLSQILKCNVHLIQDGIHGHRCLGAFEKSPDCYLKMAGEHWSYVECAPTTLVKIDEVPNSGLYV